MSLEEKRHGITSSRSITFNSLIRSDTRTMRNMTQQQQCKHPHPARPTCTDFLQRCPVSSLPSYPYSCSIDTMRLLTTTIFALIPAVTASPPTVMYNRPLAKHVHPGMQSCIGTQKQFDQLWYETRIGSPFADAKCDQLKKSLEACSAFTTDVSCNKDDDGCECR